MEQFHAETETEKTTDSVIQQIQRFWRIENPCGWDREVIRAAAKRFGAIPELLCDYYAVLGKERELNHAYNDLLAPAELRLMGNYVCFYQENQGAASWCISQDNITEKDPPVSVTYDGKEFLSECASLSDFLRVMSCFHALFALPYKNERKIIFNTEQKEFLLEQLKAVPNTKNYAMQIEFYQINRGDILSFSRMGSDTEQESYLVMYGAWEANACMVLEILVGQAEVGRILPEGIK